MVTANGVATLEAWLLDVCRSLGLPVESGASDFFEVGGTSLTAIRLLARVEASYGAEALTPDDLFERSSLREIAMSIHRSGQRVGACGTN
jgi:hypothetical protein